MQNKKRNSNGATTLESMCPSALLHAESDHVVVCLAITKLSGAKLLTRPLNR